MGSARSSSLSDLNHSFERNARKEIQKKLYRAFGLTFLYVNSSEKKIQEDHIFKRISPFIPGKRTPDKGEIDVYFAIISPQKWQVVDDSHLHDICVVGGLFADAASSLNCKKSCERLYKSPTTVNLPKEFNYYNIFEASTGTDIEYKLNQLETQMQYIIARQMERDKQKFFVDDTKPGKDKRYTKYIGNRAIQLFAFCGLIFAKDYQEVKGRISKLINDKGGHTRPCLCKMLKERRFLYMKSALFSERLELLEEHITSQQSTM
jgi:hypothetical protein